MILFHQRIIGFGEDIAQRCLVEGFEVGENGQTTDNLGYQTKRLQVLWRDVLQKVALINRLCLLSRVKTHHLGIHALSDLTLNAIESATANKEDILRIDMNKLLLWVLATALRWYIHH